MTDWFIPISFPRFLGITVSTSVLFLSSHKVKTTEILHPNIVFVMADDMGYGDVRALNPKSNILTPNLDRLAKQGMTFIDAHSPSAVCTPTRYGTLTGRYCWRSRLKRGVLNGYGEPLLETGRMTVSDLLRGAGYHTAIVGKWHLGLTFHKDPGGRIDYSKPISDGPLDHGFDFSLIIPASLDFPPYIYIRNNRVEQLPTLEQNSIKFPGFLRKGPRSPNLIMDECLDHLTEEAVDYIRSHANTGQPFFLYFPLTAPHKPVLPHPHFQGKSGLGPYGDFVIQVDSTMGRVMRAIGEEGIEKNTLLIFTSDNGSFMYRREEVEDHVADHTVQAYQPAHHTANGVLRGTKADIWEAGHRVPFFARWLGVIDENTRCDKTIVHVDLFATCAEIIDVDLLSDLAEDSFSWLPLFKGGDWAVPRAPIVHHSAAGMFALRKGNWKLVAGNGSGGREQPRGKPFGKPYKLFNLGKDPGERNDLSSAEPVLIDTLATELESIRAAGRSRK